jgi:hypothetical protein
MGFETALYLNGRTLKGARLRRIVSIHFDSFIAAVFKPFQSDSLPWLSLIQSYKKYCIPKGDSGKQWVMNFTERTSHSPGQIRVFATERLRFCLQPRDSGFCLLSRESVLFSNSFSFFLLRYLGCQWHLG